MDTHEAAPAEGNRRRRRPEQNGARHQPAAPKLRPYQNEAQQAILEHRARGIRSQIVSLATGLGKCVDPNTWVWSDGLRRFGDAWGSKRIAGPHRTDDIVAWYDDGVNPGRHIRTHAGLSIDGTLAHRIWIRRDDGFEGWCRSRLRRRARRKGSNQDDVQGRPKRMRGRHRKFLSRRGRLDAGSRERTRRRFPH